MPALPPGLTFDSPGPDTTGKALPPGLQFDGSPSAAPTGNKKALPPGLTLDQTPGGGSFWNTVGSAASRALHGAATATTGAEHWAANLPVIRDVGNVGRRVEKSILSQPVVDPETGANLGVTYGQAVSGAKQAIGEVAKPASTVAANLPGVRDIGDLMRAHPEQAQDILTLANAGLSAAQVVPILWLGATAVKAALAAALKGLGREAIQQAAKDAAAGAGVHAVERGAGIEVAPGLRPPVRPIESGTGEAVSPRPPAVAGPSAPVPGFLPKPVPSQISRSLIEAQRPTPGEGLGGLLGRAGVAPRPGELTPRPPQFPALARLLKSEEGAVSPGAVSDEILRQRTLTRQARTLEDSLYRLEQGTEADRVLARQMLESSEIKSLSAADREALHHFSEDPLHPVNPALKGVYSTVLQPMLQDINRVMNTLKARDIPFNPNVYIPRQAAEYPGLADRLGIGRARLSKTAGFTRTRTMKILEDPRSGERVVVHMKDNQVLRFVPSEKGYTTERIGTFRNTYDANGRVFTDKNGRDWIVKEATTKEVEGQTSVRYSKDSIANVTAAWLRARQIERATNLLEELKANPEFETLGKNAVGAKTADIPEHWVTTKLRQFTGWRFEPKIAAVLDQAAGAIEHGDAGALERLNRFLVSSIFFNPLIHIPNITVNWFVAGGMSRWLAPVRLIQTTAKAINEVVHMGEDYVALMRQGMPAEFARVQNRKFFESIARRAIDEAAEPSVARELSRILGSNVNPIKWLYNTSSYVTWLFDDVARLQTLYELEAKGLSREAALKEVDRVIPNYRISALTPGAKILTNSNLFMFSAYHVSLLRNLAGMAGGAAKLGARDIDRMLALGFWMTVLQPQINQAAQQVTGDPRAHFRTPGYSTPVRNWLDVAEGTKTPQQALMGTFTPSPLFTGIAETLTGRSLYTGQPVPSLWQRITDILGPARTVQQFAQSPLKGAAGLAGVSVPKFTQREARVFLTDREQAQLVGQSIRRRLAQGDTAGAQQEYDQFRARVQADFDSAYAEEERLHIPHRTNQDGSEMTFDDWWKIISGIHQVIPDPYK